MAYNKRIDYNYYPSMGQAPVKPFQISAPVYERKQQLPQTQRPERPKTLGTQIQYIDTQPPVSHSQSKYSSKDNAVTSFQYLTNNSNNHTLNFANDKVIESTENSSPLNTFNEEEEWDKISAIMASFGTDPNLVENTENTGDRPKSSTTLSLSEMSRNQRRNSARSASSDAPAPHRQLIDWLCDHRLEHLCHILIDNGYDDVDFLKGIVVESDLELLEITAEDRTNLMAAITSDLQTPSRAVTTLDKNGSNASDKMKMTSSLNSEYNAYNNNNNGSNSPQRNQNNDEHAINDSTKIDEWLSSIKLTQYSDVFR